MKPDWTDILLHTGPTAAVAVAMGFMAAFGFHAPTSFEMWCWIIASLIGLLAFSFLWTRRELRQHGGHMGGSQSWLEAIIPAMVGPIIYGLSTYAFWKWPL